MVLDQTLSDSVHKTGVDFLILFHASLAELPHGGNTLSCLSASSETELLITQEMFRIWLYPVCWYIQQYLVCMSYYTDGSVLFTIKGELQRW